MRRGWAGVLVVLAGVLVLGAVAPGTVPLTLTTPESGSMEPTLQEDALVVVLSTTPSIGDIALYESPTHTDPVLHRLVGTTDDGSAFLTQGDGNTVPDQETGEPPVTADRVYGVVPTFAGHPLAIPYLGGVLTNPAVVIGLWMTLGFSIVYSITDSNLVNGIVVPPVTQTHGVVLGVLLIVALSLAILSAPITVDAEIITTATGDTTEPHLAAPGQVTERELTMSSPFMAMLHTSTHTSGDLRITETEGSVGSRTTSVTVQNPPTNEPTVHQATITAYSYPAVLPATLVRALATIHPALAALATSVTLGGTVIGATVLVSESPIPLRASHTAIYRNRRHRTTPDSDDE